MADHTIKGLGAPPEQFDGSPHRYLIVHARQVFLSLPLLLYTEIEPNPFESKLDGMQMSLHH